MTGLSPVRADIHRALLHMLIDDHAGPRPRCFVVMVSCSV